MCEYNVQPSEYWLLSPDEVGLIIDANRPPVILAGLHENDLDELVEIHNKGDFI